jgi:beta-mannosidase
VSRQLLDGTPIAKSELAAQVDARSTATIALPDAVRTPGDPFGEVLVAELDGVRTVHTWAEDLALRLDPTPLEATVTPFDDGYRVEVRARSLARDVTLLVDRLDPMARVDDALVTLPAGTSATFTVHTTAQLTAAELTGPLVLRSANDLARSRVVPEPAVAAPPASITASSALASAEASGPVAG